MNIQASSMPADNSRQEGVEASEDEVEDHQPEESGQLQQPQKEQLVTSENEAESNGQVGTFESYRLR